MLSSELRELKYRVQLVDDGKEGILFRWHWQRGLLDKRMSALELWPFLLPHMPSITPFLSDYPQAQAEWIAMLVRFATTPPEVLDDIMPWIKIRLADEEDSIIELSLSVHLVQPSQPKSFVMS